MDLQLADNVAIVTGASRGLGLATARALAAEGCRVTICARGPEALATAADALRAVARKAVERKTGARGLRSILEATLLDTMYDLPSLKNVSKVVVDESAINGESRPLVIYEGSDIPKAAAD